MFRQAQESLIVVNAHRVNQGQFITSKSGGKADFYFIDREDPIKSWRRSKSSARAGCPAPSASIRRRTSRS